MLIQFSMENFGPFADRATLNMAPIRSYKENPQSLLESGLKGVPHVLPSVLVYGPNASGKSTLVKAAGFMKEEVRKSFQRVRGDEIPVNPFLLATPEQFSAPCGMEMIFIAQDGIRYQYGFSVNATRVLREWLYAWPISQARTVFMRTWNELTKKYDYSPKIFGENILGFRKHWLEDVLENRLFLSVAAHKGGSESDDVSDVFPEEKSVNTRTNLKFIFDWFHLRLFPMFSLKSIPLKFSTKMIDDSEGKKYLLDWLKQGDLVWDDLVVESKIISFDKPLPIPAATEVTVGHMAGTSDGKGLNLQKVGFLAKRVQDETVIPFPSNLVSDGTRTWLTLGGAIQKILANGEIIFADEIEANLHHHLVRHLWSLFNDPATNPNKAQLVATTHNVGLLADPNLLRRDQVWLIDKNRKMASELFPLSDYSPRKGEYLLKPYLQGRFGGIPRLSRNVFPYAQGSDKT
ncbi:MAG: ATP-binding protein [Magnetococcales bacterium]|nr:ATP-binding protein [Magnetococcales bacterium]NGZ28033.1 ATP-binding protein [Magnetococcales bacterium]